MIKEQIKKELIIIMHKPIFWVIMLNLIVSVYCFVFNTPYNETNDDTGMRALASGAYGDSQGYLVFINIILGKLLVFLYHMVPFINWYTLFEILVVVISFTLLGHLLIDKLGSRLGLSAYILVLGVFYAEFFSVLQFTRISILAGFVGYLYIFYFLTDKKSRSYFFIGCAEVWTCILIRQSSFKIVTLYAFVIGVFLLLLNKFLTGKKLLQYVKCFSFLFLISLSLLMVDQLSYSLNSEWRDYKEFTKLRSKLADYGFPDYQANKDAYEEMGITENDYNLYSSGILLYDDTLSVESMKKLSDLKDEETKQISKRELVKTFIDQMILDNYFFLFLVIILLFFYLNKKSSYHILFLGNIFIYFALFIYFYWLSRIVNRVMVPTTFMFIVTAVYCFDKKYLRKIRIKKEFCIAMSVLFPFISGFFFQESRKLAQNNEIIADALFKEMENKDKIYFADFASYRFNYKYFDAYHDFGKDYFSNQVHTGGWLSRMPTTNRIMNDLDVQNLSSLLKKDNAYLYTGYNEDKFRLFLETHYTEETVGYSIVNKLNDFKIIKYSTPHTEISGKENFSYEVAGCERYDKNYSIVTITMDVDDQFLGRKAYINYVDTNNKVLGSYMIYGEVIEDHPKDGKITIKAIIPTLDLKNLSKDYKHAFYPIVEMEKTVFVTGNQL